MFDILKDLGILCKAYQSSPLEYTVINTSIHRRSTQHTYSKHKRLVADVCLTSINQYFIYIQDENRYTKNAIDI